ncbi:MAG TPA: sodium:alanine symporter family protein [Clostridiales bacterium]|nr:sodium:alanine symporter family protein [Clostridiales bacterium]
MFEKIQDVIEQITAAVWGPPMVAMLIFVGGFYTFKTRFFQFVYLKDIFRKTFGQLFANSSGNKSLNAFKAMSLALGGTIGIGNIAGVSTAIMLAGPGAVFWMWVSGFIGMITKFAEVCLAVKYKSIDKKGNPYGGPMVYIIKGLGHKFKPLSVIFSVMCVLASFGIGNLTQANSVAISAYTAFGIPRLITGIALAVLVLLVICGSFKKISSFTGVFVPLMSLLYILGGLSVVIFNIQRLPAAVISIFSGALGLRQAAGGIGGYAISNAIRVGISRGIFTHESGMGSSPIAHASADGADPVIQGMWGIVEVFIDTIIVCTVTALAVLCSKTYTSGESLIGISLTSAVFSEVFNTFGSKLIAICVALFAFASIVGWSHYGQTALDYLTCQNIFFKYAFRMLFFALIIIGSISGNTIVWNLADIFNGFMAIPNILALSLLYPSVLEELNYYKINASKRLNKYTGVSRKLRKPA